jgi:hypothetical protein
LILVLDVIGAVTVVAYLLHLRGTLALLGLGLMLPLLGIFGFSNRLLDVYERHVMPILGKRSRAIIKFVVSDVTLIVRALSLAAALWVADLYVTLCSGSTTMSGGVGAHVLLATDIGITIALADYAWRETSAFVRFVSWSYTASGFLFFFVNVITLCSALASDEAFLTVRRIFEWPPIILAGDRVAASAALVTLVLPTPVWLGFLLILATYGLASDTSTRQLQGDVAAVRVAMFVLCVWLASSATPAFYAAPRPN